MFSLCKLLYNTIPLSLIQCFGLSASGLQTVFLMCAHETFTNYYFGNSLVLLMLFMNFGCFMASEVGSKEDPNDSKASEQTGAGIHRAQ